MKTTLRSESGGMGPDAPCGGLPGRHGQPARSASRVRRASAAQRRAAASTAMDRPGAGIARSRRSPRPRPAKRASARTPASPVPRRCLSTTPSSRFPLHPDAPDWASCAFPAPTRATSPAQFLSPADWQPWQAHLAELRDAEGHAIDQVVVTFFERPRSYTAEDVIEISCHGSPVVLRHAVERALAAGARLAEPGEFTLRAFLNGRLDLPQAEAVRDLIDATTLYQARIATQQAAGSVSRRIAPIKEQLLELIALLEAGIDFAEDDISRGSGAGDPPPARADPGTACDRLAASFRYGGLVRQGLTLAIVGRPNVGKSSLFNRLLEQDRAIVTEIPGHHARPGERDRLDRRHSGEALRYGGHSRDAANWWNRSASSAAIRRWRMPT